MLVVTMEHRHGPGLLRLCGPHRQGQARPLPPQAEDAARPEAGVMAELAHLRAGDPSVHAPFPQASVWAGWASDPSVPQAAGGLP